MYTVVIRHSGRGARRLIGMYSDTKWLTTGDSAKRRNGSRHRIDWLSASYWVPPCRCNTQLDILCFFVIMLLYRYSSLFLMEL